LAYRVAINSSQHGNGKAYTAKNIPPGLKLSLAGNFTGTPTASGTYVTRVTAWQNSNGSGDNATLNLTFNITGSPPLIVTPPQNLTVTAGTPAQFTVSATGEAPLTYRWLKEDLELATTTTNLTFASTKASDAGRYRVRVTSPGGVTLSDFATLTVNTPLPPPPTVTGQPANQTVNVGATATFTVVATGTGPFTYAWLKDNVDLGGTATNQSLTLPSVATTDAGSYRVRVTNAGGNTLSDPATLTVNTQSLAPTISSQTTNLTIYAGESTHLTLKLDAASEAQSFSVEWRKDGLPLAGETGLSLALTNVSTNATGLYLATVKSSGGSTAATPILVTVLAPLQVTPSREVDHIHISYRSVPGREYILEGIVLDGAGTWETLQTLKPLTESDETLELFGTRPYRFYRLRVLALP
jgi:hypothetical protein